MSDTKKIYVAYTNTDCTEGRGGEIALAISECESTVRRLGTKRYVQGSNCPVQEYDLVKIENKWFVPIHCVPFSQPTIEDRKEEAKLNHDREMKAKRDAVLERAKSIGLSDEEVELLRSQS